MTFEGESIPGQTPLADLSGLRDRSIRTQAGLNVAEARNIRKAVVKYMSAVPSHRTARFDGAWLRRVHREMFGDVWSWAGAYRRHETNIGSVPHLIEIDLHDLLAARAEWGRVGMNVEEQGARLHHRLVQIHPFANGNGRWSRLIANIHLRLNKHAIVEWPEATIGGASVIREEYLDALRWADRGDFGTLVELHRRHTPRREGEGV